MIFLVVFLVIALIISIALIILLKRDIRNMKSDLELIKGEDTNLKLTTKSFQKDIVDLTLCINDILEREKKFFRENIRINSELKETITNVSHDLRTPLTSVIGYIQLIKDSEIEEEKKKEYYDIIENRLKYLSKLINNFFEYTRAIEGKYEITIEKVNISNSLRDIISFYYESFMEGDFQVEVEIDKEPIIVLVDHEIFKRVIQNLIQNVLIHGKDEFKLIAKEKNKEIILMNRAQHMENIDVDKIFNRFYTGDISRNEKSTGLGLAIAKELVRKINGEITVYKENEFFCISLKL